MSEPTAAPAKGGKMKFLIILAAVALLSVGAGAAAPLMLLRGAAPSHHEEKKEKPGPDATVSFGEVTVNLSDGRLQRFLRIKVVLVIDGNQSKECEHALEERKAILKNWLITHLSDKTLVDVTGRISINRIRREILETFATKLFPDGGKHHLRDVLFEEFMVT